MDPPGCPIHLEIRGIRELLGLGNHLTFKQVQDAIVQI